MGSGATASRRASGADSAALARVIRPRENSGC
jgi:hypothetical protein